VVTTESITTGHCAWVVIEFPRRMDRQNADKSNPRKTPFIFVGLGSKLKVQFTEK
jgi:hypothetical protein